MVRAFRTFALLVAVALGLATSPAIAGAASITVTPNTGLDSYGQDVNVTGAGWSTELGSIRIYQCTEGGSGGVCGPRISDDFLIPDAGGGFSVTVRVESPVYYSTVTPGTPAPFECLDTTHQTSFSRYPCEVRAVQGDGSAYDAELMASAPIRFAPRPTGPAPDPGDDDMDVPPVISGLGVSPFDFPAANRGPSIAARSTGTRVRYRLSEPASIRFTVRAERPGRRMDGRCVRPTSANRNRTRCRRYVRVAGGFSHAGKRDQNSLRFTGRLGGRKLPVGFYRLYAAPIDRQGNDGDPRSVRFRITP